MLTSDEIELENTNLMVASRDENTSIRGAKAQLPKHSLQTKALGRMSPHLFNQNMKKMYHFLGSDIKFLQFLVRSILLSNLTTSSPKSSHAFSAATVQCEKAVKI